MSTINICHFFDRWVIQTLEKLGKRQKDSKLKVFEVGAINIDLQVRVFIHDFYDAIATIKLSNCSIVELQMAPSDCDRSEFAAPSHPGVRLL